MGCGQSKVRRGESASAAVAHCRDRSELLAAAIASRYALADAHRAYARSLSTTGAALHDFLRAVLDAAPPPPGPGAGDAPREGDDADADDAPPEGDDADAVLHAATASPDASEEEDDYYDDVGGHICFPSPSDEASDDDDGGGDTMSSSDDGAAADQPLPAAGPDALQPVAPAPRPPQAPPQTMQSVPQYDPIYPPQLASAYPPPYSYGPAAFGYGGGYGADGMGGYGQSSYIYNIRYARSQPPPRSSTSFVQPPQATDATASYYRHHGEAVPNSHYGGSYYYPDPYPQGGSFCSVPAAYSGHLAAPPPPTPSPPRVPSWGFLDPFEALEGYYQDHPAPTAAHAAPGRSLDDVGEDDDDDVPELEDEESGAVVRDDHSGDASDVEKVYGKSESSDGSGSGEEETEGHVEFRSSPIEVEAVEESAVEVEEQLNDDSGVPDEPPAVPENCSTISYTSHVEVVQEIKLQFDTASRSAGDVSKMLEVGKVPYCKKRSSGLKVPSMRVICGQPSKGKAIMQFEEEKAMKCGNLSSSLQKLYIWESKLLKEVKAMEKIRGLYDQKRKEQKRLYYSGAEAHKLEAMEICVKKLSTKVTIAIQIVNNTSKSINKLRDEELCPQTHEIVKGFMQMWHTMSECNQMQCHVLSDAKNLYSAMAAARLSEDHTDLIRYLEVQLLDMSANFTRWFDAQKNYTILVNEWLKKGIEYEPEVTDDGVPPFSPGQLGAPPIFTVYNNWAVNMARISEAAEVVGALQTLASIVVGLSWEKNMAAGVASSSDLQLGLARVFEAMESFAVACEKAFKDVCLHAEEEKLRSD